MSKADKYFIYVEYREDAMLSSLLEFKTLESAQSFLLKNFKNDKKMRLFKGTEIGWMYQEQIHIARQEEEK